MLFFFPVVQLYMYVPPGGCVAVCVLSFSITCNHNCDVVQSDSPGDMINNIPQLDANLTSPLVSSWLSASREMKASDRPLFAPN
jgi:hypothetical protein